MIEKKFKQHSDYELFLPGKSWVFVNPSHGCPLKCSYCIEQKDNWFQDKVTHLYSPTQTIERMVKSPLIIKDKSPLTFYNFSDPFLPQNKKRLMPILEELNGSGWNNKIGLISKINPGRKYLSKLSKLENLKIGVFVSYANLNPGLESISYESRVKLMNESRDAGLKTINYARPLVKEWTNLDRIYELGRQIKGKVDAVSLSGLRLTPEIIESLKIRGLPIPNVKSYTNKERDDNLFEKATQILREEAEVPVFWHTSCAMSYVHNEPDYNSHDIREKIKKDSCEFPCVKSQREICNSRKGNSSNKELEEIIERMGKNVSMERSGEVITLSGPTLTREDVSFARHVLPEFVKKK